MNAHASKIKGSKIFHSWVLTSLILLLLTACNTQNSTQTPTPPTTTTSDLSNTVPTSTDSPLPIEIDYWPTDGWRTSTPEEQGMDSVKLAELIDYLQTQNSIDIHSLLIIRNGYIVTDAYFYPFERGFLHDLASATKSFTSTLIGIAIDQGYTESVEQPVLDFFPNRKVANLDAKKESLTLENLLTMRSGFQCSGEAIVRQMMASPDWTQFTLDLPMGTTPGTGYAYCSLNSHLLSAIIQEISGQSTLAFAQEHLFGPLGITDAGWPADPQGNNWGWGDLKLAPHDMAKLGYLFLNNGLWDDQQVVSGAWVEAATSGSSYGYQWWIKPFGFFATGVGGQEIWVLPDRNMVVVMTGASGGGGSGAWGEQLMISRILPLADSTESLPPNPAGIATLELQVQMAAASPPPEPVPPMPQIVQSVAGQTYVMDPNPAGLLSVSLTFPETAEALWNLSFSAGPDQTQVLEWPIGLDNVYRFTRNEYGLSMGIKGEWESEEVFVVHRDVIGGYERGERYRVTFDEGQITIKIQNMGGGEALTLVGYMEE